MVDWNIDNKPFKLDPHWVKRVQRDVVAANYKPFAINKARLLNNPPAGIFGDLPINPLAPPPAEFPIRLEEELNIMPDVFDEEGDEQLGPLKEGNPEFLTRSERSTRLPRFKLRYDTQEECNLRLNGTLITIQDQVVHIQKVSQVRQQGQRGLGVIGYNRDGLLVQLLLDPNGLNLRTLDPGYIQVDNYAFLFRRKPARIYKQGINPENSVFSKAGSLNRYPLFGGLDNVIKMIKAFEDRPVIQWDKSFFEDDKEGKLQSKRLSDRIAVIRKNKNLLVEHRGYNLGFLREDTVYTEVDNIWVNRALEAVGLKQSIIKK